MKFPEYRTAAGAVCVAVAVTLASPTIAEVIIPEGNAGTALRLADDMTPLGRIKGLGNVHGMDVALSRGLLISASLNEQPRGEVKKPEGVSQDEHAAHHNGGAKVEGASAATANVGILNLVDLASGQIKQRIEVPGMVHHVTVGAADRYAVLTHPGLDAVSIVDLESRTVTATIKTGPNPNYAVYDPKTAAFYVSNAGNATISQVDPVQGYVVRNFKTPGGAEHLAIDVAGRRLFAAEADDGRVDVINLASGEVSRSFEVGGGLHGIAYDSARNAVYVSAREMGAIGWIDLATNKLSLQPVGPEPYHMALDGDKLLVSSADENVVWVLDANTHDLTSTIKTNARGHQMVVMPGR